MGTSGRGRSGTGPYETRGTRGARERRVGDRPLRKNGDAGGTHEAALIPDSGSTGRRVARPRRLQGYDYAQAGAYALTIYTDWRAHLFGRVTDSRMRLNASGRLVEDVWRELPAYYRHVVLDAFVVMPDPVHGVILFEDRALRAEVEVGPAPEGVSLGSRSEEAGRGPAPTTTEVPRHGLSEVVRGFKSMSGRRVNELRGTPGESVWQRGYYEHVVRNEEDLNRIREYIVRNPLRWSLKREDQERGLGEGHLR